MLSKERVKNKKGTDSGTALDLSIYNHILYCTSWYPSHQSIATIPAQLMTHATFRPIVCGSMQDLHAPLRSIGVRVRLGNLEVV